jgi:hypothetical protein
MLVVARSTQPVALKSVINGERARRKPSTPGFTLAEVVVSVCLVAVAFAGVIGTYAHTSYRAEWSGYSLAAQALAIQQLEQAKSAVWDTLSVPIKNEITNVPAVNGAILDIPISGTNVVWATNYATIRPILIWSNPPVSTYLVKVDTVWPFRWKGKVRYFTNTVADYMAPD